MSWHAVRCTVPGLMSVTVGSRRSSPANQLETELDQSIAEEVIDTVVVALCLVATMAPLVWIGESVELALSLMN